MRKLYTTMAGVIAVFVLTLAALTGQSNFPKENFNAIAIANDNLGAGAGRVLINVTRWSTVAERDRLAKTLLDKGPNALLDALFDAEPTGRIRTPDSIGYDLRYAFQQPGEDGGRDIVLATDRPISFWEARNRPRSVDYPFTVVQMHIDKNGDGKGTLSYAAKIRVVNENTIELENFSTAPIMLTEIKAESVN